LSAQNTDLTQPVPPICCGFWNWDGDEETSFQLNKNMELWLVVSNIFLFSPLFGEDSHVDEHIFQRGWFNHQPELFVIKFLSNHLVVTTAHWQIQEKNLHVL